MAPFPPTVEAAIPEFSFSEAEDREAERIQRQFVSRYPRSGLPTLTLEGYAIGLKRETFCWWLEVGTKLLANIVGATAYKFIVYYSQKDKKWNFKNQFKDEQEAFEATKSGILKILDLAEADRFAEIDQVPPFENQNLTRGKILYLYFPQKFLPICSVDHLRHFLRQLGQEVDADATLTILNRALLAAKNAHSLLFNWSNFRFMRFLYENLPPPHLQRYEKELPEDALSGVLEKVLVALHDRKGEEEFELATRPLVEKDGPEVLRQILQTNFATRGRIGMGTLADVPWIGIFDESTGVSAQEGIYVVYLFAADGSAVYLSLNQGTENVKGGRSVLEKRALDIRRVVGSQSDLLSDIDLQSKANRPEKYQAGNVYAMRYQRGAIPSDAHLTDDLMRFTDLLTKVSKAGISFDPRFEPIHLVLKWSPEREPRTIEKHRQIAESQGSVWWGRFARAEAPTIGPSKLEQLNAQISAAVATHVFIFRNGEMWQTDLEQITVTPSEVDAERFPDYYEKSECNLFVRLSHFTKLETDWPIKNLVLVDQPDPSKISGVLGNTTNPIYVYELWPIRELGRTANNHTQVEKLTLDWLEAQTSWGKEKLQEIIDTLKKTSPQIVLAGPPGTSKTWIAKHLAKYLTQDHSLGYRLVQFHPTYGYEQFIEGLRPEITSGHLEFNRVDGVVLDIVRLIRNKHLENSDHVILIDEMNRANLSRVFGELMYLFEYRNEPTDLLYTRGFTLPKCLLFVGTMNTADRSIRSIDIALRRRFDVFECNPDVKILEKYYLQQENLIPSLFEGFEKLNGELTDKLDRHHTIGHSFFMSPVLTVERLQQIWRRKLQPLIEEYFFDMPDVAATFTVDRYWPETHAQG